MTLDDLSTPCLLVERKRLAENLRAMQATAEEEGVTLRPHIKTHKSTRIAHWQQEEGARGLTVAKTAEAEIFVEAGFDDIRIAYTVVGRDKWARIERLRTRAKISFCVDTEAGVQAASGYFSQMDEPADVLMEIDTGHHRTGVTWDDTERLASLGRQIEEAPGLTFTGLLTHAGQAYHGPQENETAEVALQRTSSDERDRLLTAAVALKEAGIASVSPESFVLSLGSTPTLSQFTNTERGGFRITEVRPGNYVFYDAMQVALGSCSLDDCALTVWSSIVSKRRDSSGRERLYLDAGKKVLTTDKGYGIDGHGTLLYNAAAMRPLPHARITGLSEEHGWVEVPGGATVEVGDRLRIVPNHACVTVNTQDRMYLVDGQDVVEALAVDARGRVE